MTPELLNQLVADKVEVWIFHSHLWTVHLKTTRDSMQFEVREIGKSTDTVLDVWNRAYLKFLRVTGQAPELLPPRLAPPPASEYTEFKELKPGGFTHLDDDIPF